MDIPPSVANIHIQQENVQYIGSYNWIDSQRPTIIVPGAPRKYLDRTTPYSLPLHKGHTFSDENGYRMPDHALLPLIAAVDETAAIRGSEAFDWSSVDVVTDRGNLRRLYGFISGERRSTPFCIDVQLVGSKTLLLTRREEHTVKYCSLALPCWSHTFEISGTEPVAGCENSFSHHRIITYNLDGLRMVVRCEVDAFLSIRTCASWKTFPDSEDHVPFSKGAASSVSSLYPSLEILRGGQFVPQEYLIELKATAPSSGIEWDRVVPQLYFGQTNYLIIAMHHRGECYAIRIECLVTGPARERLEKMEEHVRKLGPLLRAIREVVVARGHGARLSIVGVRGRGLEIRERRSTRSCLPEDVLQRFEKSV